MSNKAQRIQQLQKYLSEDPNDPFTKYALALEFQEDQPEKATDLFDDLLRNHPDYHGTYYHAAALFAEMDEREKARDIYEKGLTILEAKNEPNALRELKNAYQNFLFEE